LITRAPYTTGKVRVWEPNGDTNTVLTDTGYDNRTPAGLLGTISLVHPRLIHVYREYPASTGKPIETRQARAELFKIDFRLLPEPSAIALLALGCAMLLGLDRARRRERERSDR